MAIVQQFEDLEVWREARGLVQEIYTVLKSGSFYRDASLREQIRRAASSTMSNIAEGFERGTRKEFIQFLNIAKGSNGEVRLQLFIALDQPYLKEGEFIKLRESVITLSRKLASFIRYLEGCTDNARVRKPVVGRQIKPATLNL